MATSCVFDGIRLVRGLVVHSILGDGGCKQIRVATDRVRVSLQVARTLLDRAPPAEGCTEAIFEEISRDIVWRLMKFIAEQKDLRQEM